VRRRYMSLLTERNRVRRVRGYKHFAPPEQSGPVAIIRIATY